MCVLLSQSQGGQVRKKILKKFCCCFHFCHIHNALSCCSWQKTTKPIHLEDGCQQKKIAQAPKSRPHWCQCFWVLWDTPARVSLLWWCGRSHECPQGDSQTIPSCFFRLGKHCVVLKIAWLNLFWLLINDSGIESQDKKHKNNNNNNNNNNKKQLRGDVSHWQQGLPPKLSSYSSPSTKAQQCRYCS